MPIIYEEVIPTPIENVTVKKAFNNGVHRTYTLKANEGYVLHDNTLDAQGYDEETGEFTDEIILGYSEGTKTCGANYDWDENPREFYAIRKGVETDG